MVFPDSHFGSFYPQNLVPDPDPQKLEARVLSDAYMINPKLYLSMDWYSDLFLVKKARIINILAVLITSLKQQIPES